MWDLDQIDALTEFAVQRLLVEGEPARRIAPLIAERLATIDPGLPALCVALPLTLAAGAIDAMLGAGPQAREAARDAWRIAALVGAEVLALQAQGQRGDVAALRERWAGDEALFRD